MRFAHGLTRLQLKIWWRKLCYWTYEVTHESMATKAEEDWADQLHNWNANPEDTGGAFYRNGVLVKRTWRGLERVNPSTLEGENR